MDRSSHIVRRGENQETKHGSQVPFREPVSGCDGAAHAYNGWGQTMAVNT